MKYGFLDESGNVGYTAGATGKFIVVVIVVGHPERLRKAVTKTRKALVRYLRDLPELKATHNTPSINEKLLTRAVEIGFDAVAVVVNKRLFPRPQDSEDLYRYACARLDQAIKAGAEDLDMPLNLQHVESHEERVLQVADAVAWALFQKHERGDETFWKIVQGKVIEVRL